MTKPIIITKPYSKTLDDYIDSKISDRTKISKIISTAKKARVIGLAILGIAILSTILPIIFIPVGAIAAIAIAATTISLGAIAAAFYITSTIKLNHTVSKIHDSVIKKTNTLLDQLVSKKITDDTMENYQQNLLSDFSQNYEVINNILEIFKIDLKRKGYDLILDNKINLLDANDTQPIKSKKNMISITQSIECIAKKTPKYNYQILYPEIMPENLIRISYTQKYKLINGQYKLTAIENPKIAFIDETNTLKLIPEEHPAYDSPVEDNYDLNRYDFTDEVTLEPYDPNQAIYL